MSVLIPLANAPGVFAIVDGLDAESVRTHVWRSMRPSRAASAYAYTTIRTPNGSEVALLHRFILGLRKGDKGVVDHNNRRKLDCRRANLRLTDQSGNGANAGLSRKSRSGLKGVNWGTREQKWRATISWRKIRYHLGYHKQKAHAGLAYNIAAQQLHGEYAALNDVPEMPADVIQTIVERVAKHLSKSFRPRRRG